MSEPDRPVAPVVQLIDTQVREPLKGSRVLALGLGGVLVSTIWGSDSADFFIAWSPYPAVPLSVKLRMHQPWEWERQV